MRVPSKLKEVIKSHLEKAELRLFSEQKKAAQYRRLSKAHENLMSEEEKKKRKKMRRVNHNSSTYLFFFLNIGHFVFPHPPPLCIPWVTTLTCYLYDYRSSYPCKKRRNRNPIPPLPHFLDRIP